ncbi:hypothetical protein NMG60_11025936 [Bertholletia excelsa]
MSWLVRSITSSLRLDNDIEDSSNHNPADTNSVDEQIHHQSDPSSPSNPERGVKENLNELTKTLSRQFWGVASFLAPPPQSPQSLSETSDSSPREAHQSAETSDLGASEVTGIDGIRSDFAEIGGKFRSGISKLSNTAAVSEFTKIASNFLQLALEEDNYGSSSGAVGVTDEVVAFARDIAMHPETWLDFPLPDNDEDGDFDMSDAQEEHALAVESLAPRLASLRIELCPDYMSEDCFWKIYFVLLHPRLNKNDAEILSTPQVVKARALLVQELQHRNKIKPEESFGWNTNLDDVSNLPQEITPLETSSINTNPSTKDADFEKEKHAVQSTEIPIIDKSVVEEGPATSVKDQSFPSAFSEMLDGNYEDDADDWLKEDSTGIDVTGGSSIPIEHEEDVSFSDLEEDVEDVPTSYKKVTSGSDSSTKESRDWVQLSRSSAGSAKDINAVAVDHVGFEQVSARNPETKEPNDWLDVEEIGVE